MNSFSSRFAAFASLAALATAPAVAPAMAQEATAEQDDIVLNTIYITTQKREQDLRDVPVAVSAVDGAFMDELGIGEFEDLARFVPGFEVQEQSPNNPGFVIRGLTSDSGDATVEPRVAVFQDGVSISRSRGSIVELFDIERVEVAKGPQPTLFGRGALIGGVNIIQAKPQLDAVSGAVTVGFGDLNETIGEAYVNVPLGDMFAVRLAGRINQRDGYVESLNPAEDDFNSKDTKALRASALFAPNEIFDAALILNWQEDTPSGTSFKSMTYLPAADGSLDPWEPANLNTFGDFQNGASLGVEREVQSTTLLANYVISDKLTLTSITGTRHFDSLEVFDADGFNLPVLVSSEDANGDQFSQEFRLNIDAGEQFTGFIGASYFKEDGAQAVEIFTDERALQATIAALSGQTGGLFAAPGPVELTDILTQLVPIPGLGAQPIYNLNLTALLGTGQVVPLKTTPHGEFYENTGKTEALEFFADGSFAVTDKLEVTAGLRYTQEDKTSGITAGLLTAPTTLPVPGATNPATGGPLVTGQLLVQGRTDGRATQSDTFDGITYRLAARYDLTDTVNLFANYARGRRPEIIAADASNPFQRFTTLPAEEVDSFEVGSKAQLLNGSLLLDGSVFYYDYKDFQTSVIEDGIVQQINAGNATAYGFETAANWLVSEDLTLVASYGYNHARFDDETNGQPNVFAGNPFRLSPDHTLSLAALYSYDLGALGSISVKPSYTWQSQVYFDNTERELISQDAYGLANLNLGWTSSEETFSAELYAKNLFDEEYIIDAGNTGDTLGLPTFIAGAPRLFGVKVSAKY